MSYTEIILAIGWALAGGGWAMWFGERRTRIFIENFKVYGTSNPLQKAVTWQEPEPEDRIEEAIDNLTNGKRRQRHPESERVEYEVETVETGIEWLLAEAKGRGEVLTREDAESEARRMLNADGPDMD